MPGSRERPDQASNKPEYGKYFTGFFGHNILIPLAFFESYQKSIG